MKYILILTLSVLPLVAQSKDPSQRNLGHGTVNPATCNAGDIFFRTDLTAGQNIMECQAANTWTQQLNSGGTGSPAGSNNDIQVNNSGSFGGGRCTMDSSQNIVCTGALTLSGSTAGTVQLGENTVPTCAAVGVDCIYADSTQHGPLLSKNNGSYYPIPQTIASGTAVLGTSAIASAACATVVTSSATGVASTDAIEWTPNASIKAVTGYAPSTSGGLSIAAYPTSGNVNFDVCNWTSGSITPGAVTLNWRVAR